MRRRLLVMLLCTTLIATVLSGCGNKGTDTKSIESAGVEEVVSEVVAEPETTTSEEVVEPAPESTEEPTPETTVNLDIVVEVSPEIQEAKDTAFPIGVEVERDFGSFKRLGDNEDYPNALENVEIQFKDVVFQVALPKDMCVKFNFNLEKNDFNTYNQDKSKRIWIFYTPGTTPEGYKNACDLEQMKGIAESVDLLVNDDITLTTIVDEELLLAQHIPAYTVDSLYGEYLYVAKYTGEILEWEGSDGELHHGHEGIYFDVFYGDQDTSADPELASYIVESFKVVE